jgi:hypothetical protein
MAVAAFLVLRDTRGGGGVARAGGAPAAAERDSGREGAAAGDAGVGEASGSVARDRARLRIIATNDLHGAL